MNADELKNFPSLNIPISELRLKSENGEIKVYDPARDKFVSLTPEEFVRQHFVEWLIRDYGYPRSLIANEAGVKVNDTKKRCDTIVYNRQGDPLMIVEYKAPGVNINQDTFDQIVRYNMALRARYLVVSNGLRHYCCVIDYKNNTYNFIPQIPHYVETLDTTGLN